MRNEYKHFNPKKHEINVKIAKVRSSEEIRAKFIAAYKNTTGDIYEDCYEAHKELIIKAEKQGYEKCKEELGSSSVTMLNSMLNRAKQEGAEQILKRLKDKVIAEIDNPYTTDTKVYLGIVLKWIDEERKHQKQNEVTTDGIPPKPKGSGILPTII